MQRNKAKNKSGQQQILNINIGGQPVAVNGQPAATDTPQAVAQPLTKRPSIEVELSDAVKDYESSKKRSKVELPADLTVIPPKLLAAKTPEGIAKLSGWLEKSATSIDKLNEGKSLDKFGSKRPRLGKGDFPSNPVLTGKPFTTGNALNPTDVNSLYMQKLLTQGKSGDFGVLGGAQRYGAGWNMLTGGFQNFSQDPSVINATNLMITGLATKFVAMMPPGFQLPVAVVAAALSAMYYGMTQTDAGKNTWANMSTYWEKMAGYKWQTPSAGTPPEYWLVAEQTAQAIQGSVASCFPTDPNAPKEIANVALAAGITWYGNNTDPNYTRQQTTKFTASRDIAERIWLTMADSARSQIIAVRSDLLPCADKVKAAAILAGETAFQTPVTPTPGAELPPEPARLKPVDSDGDKATAEEIQAAITAWQNYIVAIHLIRGEAFGTDGVRERQRIEDAAGQVVDEYKARLQAKNTITPASGTEIPGTEIPGSEIPEPPARLDPVVNGEDKYTPSEIEAAIANWNTYLAKIMTLRGSVFQQGQKIQLTNTANTVLTEYKTRLEAKNTPSTQAPTTNTPTEAPTYENIDNELAELRSDVLHITNITEVEDAQKTLDNEWKNRQDLTDQQKATLESIYTTLGKKRFTYTPRETPAAGEDHALTEARRQELLNWQSQLYYIDRAGTQTYSDALAVKKEIDGTLDPNSKYYNDMTTLDLTIPKGNIPAAYAAINSGTTLTTQSSLDFRVQDGGSYSLLVNGKKIQQPFNRWGDFWTQEDNKGAVPKVILLSATTNPGEKPVPVNDTPDQSLSKIQVKIEAANDLSELAAQDKALRYGFINGQSLTEVQTAKVHRLLELLQTRERQIIKSTVYMELPEGPFTIGEVKEAITSAYKSIFGSEYAAHSAALDGTRDSYLWNTFGRKTSFDREEALTSVFRLMYDAWQPEGVPYIDIATKRLHAANIAAQSLANPHSGDSAGIRSSGKIQDEINKLQGVKDNYSSGNPAAETFWAMITGRHSDTSGMQFNEANYNVVMGKLQDELALALRNEGKGDLRRLSLPPEFVPQPFPFIPDNRRMW